MSNASPKHLAACLTLTLALACGGGGGGSAPAPPPPPIPAMVGAPTIELDLVGTYTDPATGELKGDPAGTATVAFDLEQGAGDSSALEVQYSLDGGLTWLPASVLEDLSDVTAPATGGGGTAPQGTAVTETLQVTWAIAEDLGPGDFAAENEGAGYPAVELRVVVVGGEPGPPADEPVEVDLMGFPFPSEELMGTARSGHASAVLDGVDLLVVGGEAAGGVPVSGAELGSRQDDIADFVFAGAGSLGASRAHLARVFLPDGRLLLAGGRDAAGALALAEVYDPVTEAFAPVAPMVRARAGAATLLLPNGLPVVLGGDAAGDSYEIYDPALDQWHLGSLSQAYAGPVAVGLPDGRILLTGAAPDTDAPRAEYLAQAGDTALTSSAAPTPTTARHEGTATVLLDGTVLAFGGRLADGSLATPTAERFDPAAGTWTALPDDNASVPGYLSQGRYGHAATLTGSGRLLVAGGRTAPVGGHLARTDYFLPEEQVFTPSGLLPEARAHHQVDRLSGGFVVISGGLGDDGGGEAPVGTTATLVPPEGGDTPPVVTITDMTYSQPLGGGLVTIDYTIADAESHPARVRVEWTTRPDFPNSWRAVTPKLLFGLPLGDGYVDLATSPEGTAHGFGWDATADDIFSAGSPAEIHVRVTAIGAAEGPTAEYAEILP